jgi:hypothetical protein
MRYYLQVPENAYLEMAETSFCETDHQKNCTTNCTTAEKNKVDTFRE